MKSNSQNFSTISQADWAMSVWENFGLDLNSPSANPEMNLDHGIERNFNQIRSRML